MTKNRPKTPKKIRIEEKLLLKQFSKNVDLARSTPLSPVPPPRTAEITRRPTNMQFQAFKCIFLCKGPSKTPKTY